MPRELLHYIEYFKSDGHGGHVFDYVSVAWRESTGELYYTRLPLELRMEEDVEKMVGTHIPEAHIYPPWIDGTTEAPTPLPPNTFVKKGHLKYYNGTPIISEWVADEVKIMEKLAKHPHPNIVGYLGCVPQDGRITGICLRKYVCNLYDLIHEHVPSDQRPPFDPEGILHDIRKGINHLHSLGLVHDDLGPWNVMVDEQGRAIIVDFDAAGNPGEPSRRSKPEHPDFRAFSNDEKKFGILQKWVRREIEKWPSNTYN